MILLFRLTIDCTYILAMYHHQQNKWYPKGVYLPLGVPFILLSMVQLDKYMKKFNKRKKKFIE